MYFQNLELKIILIRKIYRILYFTPAPCSGLDIRSVIYRER